MIAKVSSAAGEQCSIVHVFVLQKASMANGESAQQFGVLAALAEGKGLVPSIHIQCPQCPVMPVAGNLTRSSGLPKPLKSCAYTHFRVHMHGCTHAHNFKIIQLNHGDRIFTSQQLLRAYSSLRRGGP